MFDALVDNLSRLENLNIYVPSLIQLSILIIWIIVLRVTKSRYQASLRWSLVILIIAILAQLFTLTSLARTLAEYSFMLMGVGIIQIVFTKNEHSKI